MKDQCMKSSQYFLHIKKQEYSNEVDFTLGAIHVLVTKIKHPFVFVGILHSLKDYSVENSNRFML